MRSGAPASLASGIESVWLWLRFVLACMSYRARLHSQKLKKRLQAAKASFLAGLRTLGLEPIPSVTHYFILKVGNAVEFRRKLLGYKIQVRDCASFGLPDYIRIATRKPEENVQLLSALKEML